MLSFSTFVTSSVGKKIMTGVTGLALCLFVLSHLIGNLLLLVSADAFNLYTHKLEQMGVMLYFIESGLLLAFLLHAATGIQIYFNKRRARPQDYAKKGNADDSKKSWSSLSMALTGIVLLVFLVLHLKTFKYGPQYETLVEGVVMRDLYRLVIDVFQKPAYVISYVVVMALLGVHLRHGFWSAFQSLGVNHPRYSPIIFGTGIGFALIIALGFIVLPVWIYVAY